jgi:hypothetical protein
LAPTAANGQIANRMGPAGQRNAGGSSAPETRSPSGGSPAPVPHTIVPGAWSIDPSGNPAPGTSEELNGTSCTSGSFCVAVGYNYTGSTDHTLVEQWNGVTWSVVTSPNVSATMDDYLYGVSCAAASFCVAVGYNYTGSTDHTLVEQWNGVAWSIVPSPNGPAGYSYLENVSCTSLSFCVAVGNQYNGSFDQTLIEQWNGTTWSVVTSPDTSATLENDLYSVSCVSPQSCTAVGDVYLASDIEQTLIEQWNGTMWSIVSSPNTSASMSNFLEGVSCTSALFCVAVGADGQPGNTPADSNSYRTLVEQWNGSSWSMVASPNTADGFGNLLYGVSCVGPTSCVAVGSPFTDALANTYVTLALSWDGTSWVLQSTPNPVVTSNHAYFEAVSCVAGQTCMAVGGYENNASDYQTLIESASIPRPGYRFVASDGGVFSYGGASFNGSAGSLTLNKPVVGMAATPDGGGYWLVASDGGIFSYGDAYFYGSTGSLTLNKPIVGMASTPNGGGYWLVASDGGIFAFGDASFFGSTGSLTLNKPIVGMAATPDGQGYWLVASDGGVFSYGDATFHGSTGSLTLNKPIVGMSATVSGSGYWLVASDGGIFAFGDATFHGSAGSLKLNQPVVGMATDPSGEGYWLVAMDGGVFAFGDAIFYGSTGSLTLNKPIVGMSA